MRNANGLGIGGILVVLFVLWGVVEFVKEFWQAIIALTAVGLLVYVVCRDQKSVEKKIENPKYEEREPELQLPPETNFISADDDDWKTIELGGGAFYSERGMGEPFETYYRLSEVIQTNKSIYAKLAACEEAYKILPEYVRAELKECGNLPNTILCRDVGVDLYLRLGQWAKAQMAINKCITAGVYEDDGRAALEYFNRYKQTAEIALDFLKKNEGFLQRNIYKALSDTPADKDCLKNFARSSFLIRKEKVGNTNKLFLNVEKLLESDVVT